MSPEQLFFSSLDADSEGQEGIFYSWREEELDRILASGSTMFKEYYSCNPGGNWNRGLNVIRISMEDEVFRSRHSLTSKQLDEHLKLWKSLLMSNRDQRIRPATDIKIITSWNGMAISGFIDTFRATGNRHFLERALVVGRHYGGICIENHGFLWRTTGSMAHQIPGFLDDYAFMMKAFLELYQVTFDHYWLRVAGLLNERVVRDFSDEGGIFFRYGGDKEQSLMQETYEITDHVIPSSNSQMALNLFTLGTIIGRQELLDRAERMLKSIMPELVRTPGYHYNWFDLLRKIEVGTTEVTIIGEACRQYLHALCFDFSPDVIFSGSSDGSELGIFSGKLVLGETLIYICRSKTCFQPVRSVNEAKQLIG